MYEFLIFDKFFNKIPKKWKILKRGFFTPYVYAKPLNK